MKIRTRPGAGHKANKQRQSLHATSALKGRPNKRSPWGWIRFQSFSPRNKKRFFINLFIGIIISFGMHLLRSTSWGAESTDRFFDLFILSEAKKHAAIPWTMKSTPICFIEIDHAAYQQWGEPALTPPEKLAGILDLVYEGAPRVIILDILLEEQPTGASDRAELENTFKRIHDDQRFETKIIYPQRIGFMGDRKMTIFDSLHKKLKISRWGKFIPASPKVTAPSRDHVVRFWNLFDTYLGEDGQTKYLWSIPITTATLMYNGNTRQLIELEKSLKSFPRGTSNHSIKRINLAEDKHIYVSPNSSHPFIQRIRYEYIPPQTRKFKNDQDKSMEENVFQISIKLDEIKDYQDVLKGKIVIIGHSSPDVGDIHPTPVGSMPGFYILGNAINTLISTKQPSPPPLWVNWSIEFFVIFISAYAFLFFNPKLAQIVLTILILIGIGYISYLYFIKTSVFLNFALAAAGIGIHEMLSDFKEILGVKK